MFMVGSAGRYLDSAVGLRAPVVISLNPRYVAGLNVGRPEGIYLVHVAHAFVITEIPQAKFMDEERPRVRIGQI